jgi:hypothetical protein
MVVACGSLAHLIFRPSRRPKGRAVGREPVCIMIVVIPAGADPSN